MRRTISITWRITAVFSVLIVVALASVGILISVSIRSSLDKLQVADALQIVSARADQASGIIEKLKWQLNTISLQADIRAGDRGLVQTYFRSYDGKMSPDVYMVYLAWEDAATRPHRMAQGGIYRTGTILRP